MTLESGVKEQLMNNNKNRLRRNAVGDARLRGETFLHVLNVITLVMGKKTPSGNTVFITGTARPFP